MDKLIVVVVVCVLGGAAAVALIFLRKMQSGEKFFTQKERRLAFVERTMLDGGRKLLLVRRDDVEHLVMIGGPIDLVIETGIPVEFAVRDEQDAHDDRQDDVRPAIRQSFRFGKRPQVLEDASARHEPGLSFDADKDKHATAADAPLELTTAHETRPSHS